MKNILCNFTPRNRFSVFCNEKANKDNNEDDNNSNNNPPPKKKTKTNKQKNKNTTTTRLTPRAIDIAAAALTNKKQTRQYIH